MTPRLSLGGEVFWAGGPRKSGIGYAARYETDKMVIPLLIRFNNNNTLTVCVLIILRTFSLPTGRLWASCKHWSSSYELCSEGFRQGKTSYNPTEIEIKHDTFFS